jgi:hypothetical protein
MKKKRMLVLVAVAAFCGSVFGQSSGGHPFSGFWARKSDIGTLLFYFLGNTYQLMIIEGGESQLGSLGVFSVKGNQLMLYGTDTYKGGAAVFTYGDMSGDGMFMLSKDVNDTPLVGLWSKVNGEDPTVAKGAFAKVTGVWEARGDSIVIFRIYPDGGGWCYRCGADMTLKDCWKVKFTATDDKTGTIYQASETFAGAWLEMGEYQITGNKLVIGNSTYTKR